MALIEKYHVVAALYPIHAGEEIIEGMWVKLNTSGEAILATGASGEVCIGVAGDTKTATTTVGIPTMNSAHGFSADGVTGTTTSFVNRVSDQYDETKASGKVTVYMAGGEFATNQYETDVASMTPAAPTLYVSGNGKLTGTPSTSAQVVAYLTKAAGAYESGVPGIDVNGSMTLGNYCEFKMVI